MKPTCAAFCLIALLAVSPGAFASRRIHLVCADGSGDFATIQEAVNASVDGDVIELCDGTFTGDGNRDVDFVGKAVTVRSQSGNPANCIINCQGEPGDEHRAFALQSGESDARIEGITVTGGYITAGAGILIRGADASIANCVFSGNQAQESAGGLQVIYGGSALVEDCRFENNTVAATGGGASVEYSEATFRRCEFTANDCGWTGGGALVYDASAHFELCTFVHNIAEYGGGICFSQPDSSSIVTNCTFFGNEARSLGAALCPTQGAEPPIQNSIIAFSSHGGATYCGPNGALHMLCCDIYGNVGGDWTGYIAEQFGQAGNISDDPLFCSPSAGQLTLANNSPCGPDHNPDCGLIGAHGVGCEQSQDAPDERAASPTTALIAFDGAFPNPSSSKTAVRFDLASARELTLSVFDLAGRHVRTLWAGKLSGGSHSLIWNQTDDAGRRVAPGIYLARLTSGELSVTGRLVVLK